jgi:quinol monooxygenase YgiN
MFVITAEFRLEPGMLSAFMPLMLIQAEKSLAEETGCLVFDVCIEQDTDDDIILLYEVYRDEAAFSFHMETPHYLAFSETVSDLVADKSVRRFDCVASQTGYLQ